MLLRVLVAGGVLALLFYKIPSGTVWDAVSDAQPIFLLGAFGVSLLAEFVIAYRLRWFVEAHAFTVSTADIFATNLSSRFYALGLPGGNAFAMVMRVHRMVQGSGRYADIAMSVLLDRITTTAAMSVFGLVLWMIDRSVFFAAGAVLAAAAVLLSLLYVLLLMWPSVPVLARLVVRLERRVPKKFERILRSAAPAREPLSLTVRTWLLSFAVHGLGTVSLWLISRAIGIDVPMIALAWIRAIGLLAAALPVSIAGLGVREGLFVMLLKPYGVAAPDAFAFSLISFAVVVLGMGLIGALLELGRALPRWRPE